jgi:hypothetical protein
MEMRRTLYTGLLTGYLAVQTVLTGGCVTPTVLAQGDLDKAKVQLAAPSDAEAAKLEGILEDGVIDFSERSSDEADKYVTDGSRDAYFGSLRKFVEGLQIPDAKLANAEVDALDENIEWPLRKVDGKFAYVATFSKDFERPAFSPAAKPDEMQTYATAGQFLTDADGELLVLLPLEGSLPAGYHLATSGSDLEAPKGDDADLEAAKAYASTEAKFQELLAASDYADGKVTLERRDSPWWTHEDNSLLGLSAVLTGGDVALPEHSVLAYDAANLYVVSLDGEALGVATYPIKGDSPEEKARRALTVTRNYDVSSRANLEPAVAERVAELKAQARERSTAINAAAYTLADALDVWTLPELKEALDANSGEDWHANASQAYRSLERLTKLNSKVKGHLVEDGDAYFGIQLLRNTESFSETGTYLGGVWVEDDQGREVPVWRGPGHLSGAEQEGLGALGAYLLGKTD